MSEAAVISAMPRTREPALKAFVTINKGFTASARLNQEIKAYVKANLSLEVDLKEVSFIDEMPQDPLRQNSSQGLADPPTGASDWRYHQYQGG